MSFTFGLRPVLKSLTYFKGVKRRIASRTTTADEVGMKYRWPVHFSIVLGLRSSCRCRCSISTLYLFIWKWFIRKFDITRHYMYMIRYSRGTGTFVRVSSRCKTPLQTICKFILFYGCDQIHVPRFSSFHFFVSRLPIGEYWCSNWAMWSIYAKTKRTILLAPSLASAVSSENTPDKMRFLEQLFSSLLSLAYRAYAMGLEVLIHGDADSHWLIIAHSNDALA